MGQLGEWGGHATLQAAADVFNVNINILTAYAENWHTTITPFPQQQQAPQEANVPQQTQDLWLSFWPEVRTWSMLKLRGTAHIQEQQQRRRSGENILFIVSSHLRCF
jgi:hypothetical protein